MLSVLPDRFKEFEDLGDASPFVERILQIIEHIELFEDFDAAEIASLARYMRCFKAPPGVEVIVEGEPGDFMLLLIEGTMEIVKIDFRGLRPASPTPSPARRWAISVIDERASPLQYCQQAVFAVLDRKSFPSSPTSRAARQAAAVAAAAQRRLRSVSMQLMKCLDDKRLRRT
jgi:hypothetical protein